MAAIELRNETELEFMDISSEKHRKYTFPNGNELVILRPQWLNVSKSGGHRLVALNNICYYIQPDTGLVIQWAVGDDDSHFVM